MTSIKMVYEQYHFDRSHISSYTDNSLRKLINYSHLPIHKLSFKGDICAQKGVIDKDAYKRSILHFFSRKDVFEELQKKGLIKEFK